MRVSSMQPVSVSERLQRSVCRGIQYHNSMFVHDLITEGGSARDMQSEWRRAR